jgi:hypothetical protein
MVDELGPWFMLFCIAGNGVWIWKLGAWLLQ